MCAYLQIIYGCEYTSLALKNTLENGKKFDTYMSYKCHLGEGLNCVDRILSMNMLLDSNI